MTDSLKWKPPELNTVDFRISAKWSREHKPIYKLEVLSHGVTYKFYDHFQPEPSLAAEYVMHKNFKRRKVLIESHAKMLGGKTISLMGVLLNSGNTRSL